MLQTTMSEYERNHLSRLSDDDIDHIWSLVSCFIEQQMFMRKGVYIFGLGTFTFCQQKLNLGNKYILKQRPVFILSEKLSQYYGFKQIKPQATGAPVVPLNFSALSAEGPFHRDAVERCVRETLLLLLRAAATRQSISHAFPGIGVLTFQQSRVQMQFSRDFISALDGSGKLSSASASRRTLEESERPRTSAGEPQPHTDEDDDDEKRRTADRATPTDLTDKRPANTDRGVSRPAGGALSITTVKRSSADESLMCCDHRQVSLHHICSLRSGLDSLRRGSQELCYVCMQRAQRNLSLYRSDERSRAEREQEPVLMLGEHQRDLQYFQKEEMDRQKKREDSQKLAVFNLAVAEAQRRRKAQASSQSDGSYIFAGRACSADRVPQQRIYMQQLMLEAARRRRTQTQTEQHLLQLSEEIALERSQQLREKHETAKNLRKALEAQMDRHWSEISPRLDARPVFGLMDSSPAALAEQRRRAQNISEELMNTANHRRRETLEKRLNEQKREREMMQRDLKEMLDERMRRYEKLCLLRAACEESWQRSTDLKHQRDREELNIRRFGGQTLTEQLGRYERCSQCKRSTANRGESNVFRDTNYVSGARMML